MDEPSAALTTQEIEDLFVFIRDVNKRQAVHKVVEKAREKGVFVEAEIGRIRGDSSYETSYTGDDYLFLLEEAKLISGSP